ncbi:MAG: hypothetical protein H0X40_17940 [Chthoniobacterales bacterium]|nr:hypothetical protein [Chthoniobacterales bacterium]
MNWFRQNKFLGGFLVAFAVATLLAGYFFLHEKGEADDQQARLESTINELTNLRSMKPFPNAVNLQKSKAQAENYRDSLAALENELKSRSLPVVPLQPNEFQAQLRQAVTSVIEDAAASKVALPPNFYLGFDEYATSLPNSTAAPLLGQELQAIAMLTTGIISAHVDALHTLVRAPLPEEKAAPTPAARGRATGTPAAGATTELVAARSLEISFSAGPAAARKVLNQIATTKEQLFIIRTLNVKNQVDKGPPRGTAAESAAPSPPPGVKATSPPAVSFIVGSEHLDIRAKIDIVSLNPEKGTR